MLPGFPFSMTGSSLKILILSHSPELPFTLQLGKMGLGDAIRIGIATKCFSKTDLKIDICTNKQAAGLFCLNLVSSKLDINRIYTWDDVGLIDFSHYKKIIYVDHPATWPEIKKQFNLPECDLLYGKETNRNYKRLGYNLITTLISTISADARSTKEKNKWEISFSSLYRKNIETGKRIKKIGLNYLVPNSWKLKSPSIHLWTELYELLTSYGCTVSWQQGKTNLLKYIDWIYQQDLLITANSLGFHMALLFDQEIILFQGPTSCEDVTWLNPKTVFKPNFCDLSPCFKKKCPKQSDCFKDVNVEDIVNLIKV